MKKKYLKKVIAAFFAASVAFSGAEAANPADASDFVVLSDVIPDIVQEIRYYGTYNFVGDRIRGYYEPVAFMTKDAARALKAASDEFNAMGYRIKVYDAYRPQMAVDNFKEWAEDLNDMRMKPYFYPEVDKRNLFRDGYIDAKSGHSRGSAIDLTLIDKNTGKELDMGGVFDYFGMRSHPDFSGDLTEAQKKNRKILQDVMEKHGYKILDTEWWHFFLKNEPYPDTYFTFPVDKANLYLAQQKTKSPDWVTKLPAAKTNTQMVVVGTNKAQGAWVSMHEKDENGVWQMIMTTPAVIGKNGINKTKEGDSKTPVGVYRFNKAFGIADNPGTKLSYTKVDENIYWSGDVKYKYNQMVDIRDYPMLNKKDSEHIAEYNTYYDYCLNISYNEEGTPGKGSAIFMHCFGTHKPYTGGCIALPKDKMRFVMQRVEPNCAVVIDSLEKLGGKF